MEELSGEGDVQDRALRALEVASVSGFLESCLDMQEACLSLCNACRGGVPVQRLKISTRGPPTLRAMLCPDIYNSETETPSRVEPPRRVLIVEIRDSRWAPMPYRDYHELEEAVKAHLRTIPEPCVDDVRWPAGTKEIYLTCQSESIDQVVWPEDLELLSFSLPLDDCNRIHTHHKEIFNSPLDGLRFPSGLREIFMGMGFNQSIEGVTWPPGLERLSLPRFNWPIEGVRWPAGLKSLEFMPPSEILVREDPDSYRDDVTFMGPSFNQALSTALPASLETLWLSDSFDQSLDGVVLPTGLISLGVGMRFPSTYFGGVSWPPGLQNVYTVNGLEDDNNPLPDHCLVVTVRVDYLDEDDEDAIMQLDEIMDFDNDIMCCNWDIDDGEIYLEADDY